MSTRYLTISWKLNITLLALVRARATRGRLAGTNNEATRHPAKSKM